jgi:hypothetical protein
MNVSDDNLIFDRLADGELTLAERQELLSSLDRMSSSEARADGWRRCALALLEAQVLRRELKAFLTQEASTAVARSTAAVPLARPQNVRWLGSSLAVAASALVAFGIGWNMNGGDAPTPVEQVAVNDTAVAPQNSRDAVTLVVNDTQGRQQRVQLPLVDAGEVGQQWAHLSPEVPVNVKTGLRDYGFDLQSKQRFAPLFFEHGKQLVPMAVPVNDTYVVPVNRPVY